MTAPIVNSVCTRGNGAVAQLRLSPLNNLALCEGRDLQENFTPAT